jgi:catechol 2,3-dioxygenase-like lactoylglutathione lyase family enzyme
VIRTWTIIGVHDVATSHAWYQALLGLPATAPAHDHFAQLLDTDGTVLLCLHAWDAHEHPTLMRSDTVTAGHGLLLFLRVSNFADVLSWVQAHHLPLEDAPHENPNTGTMEFSLRDPDGYFVTISSLGAA